jgi:hypothetical protein
MFTAKALVVPLTTVPSQSALVMHHLTNLSLRVEQEKRGSLWTERNLTELRMKDS